MMSCIDRDILVSFDHVLALCEQRITQLQVAYQMSSDQMRHAVDNGIIATSGEIGIWLMALRVRDELLNNGTR